MSRWRNAIPSLLLILIAAEAPGGAVAVSRYSVVSAIGETSDDHFLLRDEFGEFGSYDHGVADSLNPALGGTTSASASQQSDLDAATLSGQATGDAAAQVAELDAILATGVSGFNFLFDITGRPETLTLTGDISATHAAGTEIIVENEPRDQVYFERTVGVASVLSFHLDDDIVLHPGRYRLRINTEVPGQPSPESGRFAVSFSLTSTAGNVVPLPAAFWPGIILLAIALLYVKAGASFGKNFS